MDEVLKSIEGIDESHVDQLAALGVISVFDVEEVGSEYLAETLRLDKTLTDQMVETCNVKGKVVAEQQAIEKEAAAKARAEAQALEAAGLTPVSGAAEEQAAAILGQTPTPASPSTPLHSVAMAEAAADSNAIQTESNDDTADAAAHDGSPEGEKQPGGILEMLESRQDAAEDVTADAPEVPDPSDPEADPTGASADEVEMAEAIQQGGAAEMLADATAPEAGVVSSSADELDNPGASRASTDAVAPTSEPKTDG